jgi:hypothetical protein
MYNIHWIVEQAYLRAFNYSKYKFKKLDID